MSYSVPTVGNLVGVIHCAMAIRGSRSALLSALNILCVEVKEKSKCSVVVGITAICLFANIGMDIFAATDAVAAGCTHTHMHYMCTKYVHGRLACYVLTQYNICFIYIILWLGIYYYQLITEGAELYLMAW